MGERALPLIMTGVQIDVPSTALSPKGRSEWGHGFAAVALFPVREQGAGVPAEVVNGVELYYEARGSGAPLVVLGGLGLDVSEMGRLTGPR